MLDESQNVPEETPEASVTEPPASDVAETAPENSATEQEETSAPVEAEPVAEEADESLPVAESAEEKPRKKKRGYVRYSPFSLVILAICAFVFSFSMFGLLEQNLLDAAGESTKEDLSQMAFPEQGDTSNDGSLVPDAKPNVDKWKEISVLDVNPNALPFLSTVNFGALKAENADTVGWMYMPSTADVKGLPINLPLVQSTDNNYYLTRSFDRTASGNGWTYVDYRNNLADLRSNKNLIIYGHARSYLMFGGLKYLNQQTRWQQDGNNQFIYVNTPTERTVWQIFSWYETTIDFDYISTSFGSDAEYLIFLRSLQEKNQIPVFEQFDFAPSDRILTLSTCKGTDENVRVAVHAVLVRHEILNTANPLPDSDSTGTMQPGSDEMPSTDSGTVTDTGSVTDTDETSGSTQLPSVTVTDPNLPSDSGSVVPSGPASVTTDAAQGGSTDGGTPSDTSQPELSGGISSQAPSGGENTDGETPSDTTLSSAPSDSSDAPEGGGSTDSETPADTSSVEE